MEKLLGEYRNGNYNVRIYSDGTKVRYNNLDTLEPDTVESFDLKITNQCDRMCRFCLIPSTKVNVGDSIKNICDISIGDYILSSTGEVVEARPCTKTYKRPYKGKIICIETSEGTLKLTPNHKVYTNRGYIRADKLTLEDVLYGI